MFEKAKAKVSEVADQLEGLGSSLRMVLYVAVSALAVALIALSAVLVSLNRKAVTV